ncbi:MAG TPA: IS110 family transposase [Bryobacteraceae bacterium]|nr:IS110 family transposase [Bryobacteraceae bacterium]
MKIIGCDFHPSYQQIAMVDEETGELTERRLLHAGGEAQRFYESLAGPVRVGMEAEGHSQWFERLLQKLGHELWIGDAARVRAKAVRRQKTDARDAAHLLELLLRGDFPRLWVPTWEERDLRQLIVHRVKLVRLQTQIKNQLQALALNQGLQKKGKLWSAAGREQLRALELAPWAARRREDLLRWLEQLEKETAELHQQIAEQARVRPEVARLMTHPGVGPITGLAFVLTLGPWRRFGRSKQVASYCGLIPTERSSGGRQRLGHISKQGSPLLRWLLVEAAQSAVRHEPEMQRRYRRLAARKSRALAKVAAARQLATRLYWMLRTEKDYAQLFCRGTHAGQPESSCGRKQWPAA